MDVTIMLSTTLSLSLCIRIAKDVLVILDTPLHIRWDQPERGCNIGQALRCLSLLSADRRQDVMVMASTSRLQSHRSF